MKTNNPLQFVKAAHRYLSIPYRRTKSRSKPLAVVIGFSPWKTFIDDWLPDFEVRRRTYNIQKREFYTIVAPMLLSDPNSHVFVWAYKVPGFVTAFCERYRIPITRVEDGFLRSVQLGATKAPPISIVMDKQNLYFDATGPSDMEDMLNTYNFDANPEVEARGIAGIDALLATKLSKYNVGANVDVEAIYGPKDRPRVLVVGQVEGDMSILKGCKARMDNNDLVWIAAQENPDAQIIYKPHPEVIRGIRKDPPQSDPREVEGVATVLYDDIALADAFNTVDRVYTITSLSGFEALLRGIPVTCLGAPFYSGWGLTDDRQPVSRRKRKLTIGQLFAVAYILYPRYFSPFKKQFIEFEEALSLLSTMKVASVRKAEMVEARKVARAEAQAIAVTVEPPPPVKPTTNEVKIEAIRAIRHLFNVIDPPPKPKAPAKPPAKKVAAKPAPKKR